VQASVPAAPPRDLAEVAAGRAWSRPLSVRIYTLGLDSRSRDGAAAKRGFESQQAPPPPPILVLHGVGFGLMSYLSLLSRLAKLGRPIICLKIRHVSM